MKARLNYRPDLRACELEDRLLPVAPTPNQVLGAVLLTTGGSFANIPLGVMLLTPAGYTLQSALPGVAIPALFVMTGSSGISSMQPGNPELFAIIGASGNSGTQPGNGTNNGGAAGPIIVGSGANDAVAPIIPLVTRNTIANDAMNAAPLIGRASRDRSDVLPLGQVYRSGVATDADGHRGGQHADEGPVRPLPIRLRSRPHRLASDASRTTARTNANGAP